MTIKVKLHPIFVKWQEMGGRNFLAAIVRLLSQILKKCQWRPKLTVVVFYDHDGTLDCQIQIWQFKSETKS
jgi:hypothetical protein